MFIFVAHTGKTLELDVQSSVRYRPKMMIVGARSVLVKNGSPVFAKLHSLLPFAPPRVEAVQQALVELTGIPVEDQVVICDGARLDPARSLAAYKLPAVSQLA